MVVFMDLDGTCADISERLKAAGPEPCRGGKDFSAWLKRVQNKALIASDKPIPGMRELALNIAFGADTELIYLTGRSEIYRGVTKKWLREHNFPLDIAKLVMRPKNNRKPNGILKEELIKSELSSWQLIPYKESILVIDDDQVGDIEEMCKRNGYTFLKAKSGS